jgi:protein-disulfide isomerase
MRTICLTPITVLVALAPLVGAQTTSGARQPIARVFGEPVYDEELLPSIGGQLYQLKTQEYELKSKALTNLVNQRLLEREAKSQGLSTDAFLEQMVDRKQSAPSGPEIEAYYLAQKDRLNNRPLNEIRPQIEQALIQAKRQQARQDYIDRLKQKASVSILLSRPRVAVTADPNRLRGNADAPVTIVEFADFQCPYCEAAEATLKQVLQKYEGRVQLGFRDFPLRQIHPQAQSAAEASRCAGNQGKFWEYHDVLFANQTDLNENAYAEHARKIGLDVAKFQACLDSGSSRPLIESDLQSGMAVGVTGTPAFYINGAMLSGAQPASDFESIIDLELANAKTANSAK